MSLRKTQESNEILISHKHNFILFRPTKVAGTSIQLALGVQCGEQDIVPSHDISFKQNRFDVDCKSFCERYKPRNCDKINNDAHLRPINILNKFGEHIFSNYYKITIIRNPWDAQLSSFWNNLIRNKSGLYNEVKNDFKHVKKLFTKFITDREHIWNPNDYYFTKDGDLICDHYLRFENIEEDYKDLCKILNLKYEKIPRAKGLMRKLKNHYSEYYNEKTLEIVRKKNEKMIEQFGYRFEREGEKTALFRLTSQSKSRIIISELYEKGYKSQ